MLVSILHKRFIKGFTLAEILIALLVVGVVASIVIPALINDTQDQELRTMWTKEFGAIDQAIYQLEYENGWFIDTGTSWGLLNALDTKIAFVRKDTWGNITTLPTNFYYKCYKAPDSTNKCESWMYRTSLDWIKTGVATNGTFLYITQWYADCRGDNWRFRLDPSDPSPTKNLCAEIAVDVNGEKGPNMIGKDYFVAVLLKANGRYYFKPSAGNCQAGHPDDVDYSLGCSKQALLNGPMP